MRKKIFTLLTLMLAVCSGAWADDVTVTYVYTSINASGSGTSSVDDIFSGMTVGLSRTTKEDFNGTTSSGSGYTYNSVSIPNYARIKTVTGQTTDTGDYVRFTIMPVAGVTFTPTSVSLGAIREGTDGGVMTVSANSTALTETTKQETSVKPGRNSEGKLEDGYTFSYNISGKTATNENPLYIDVCMSGIGASNNSKSWGIWNVVVTGTYVQEDVPLSIKTNPASAVYVKDASATALSVLAKGGKEPYIYQWYTCDNNNKEDNPKAIDGATSSTYTPSTASAGTSYYFCKVTDSASPTGAEVTSDVATITVYPGFSSDGYNTVADLDFTSMPNTAFTTGDAIGKIWNQGNGVKNDVLPVTNDGFEFLAIQKAYTDDDKKGWKNENGSGKGLLEGSGAGRCAAIRNIKSGWVVEFYHTSGNNFYTKNDGSDAGIEKTILWAESGHHVFRADEDGMVGFELDKGKYVNRIVVWTTDDPITVTFSNTGADTYSASSSVGVYGFFSNITLPSVNQRMSKAGYTQTGWTANETNYSMGQKIAEPAVNTTFNPVFTANETSLDRSEAETAITWNFRSSAVSLNLGQGDQGFYVKQAAVNGKTIDVPLKIDASADGAKFTNKGRNDEWIQANVGTVLTLPAIKGMKVVMNVYQAFGTAETVQTTINGSTSYSLSNDSKTATYTYTGENGTIDINIGSDIRYISTMTVTYPIAVSGPADPVSNIITEVATINSNGTASSTVTPSGDAVITTSGNTNSTALGSYSCGLKLESSAGLITIALPAEAQDAQVTLLSSGNASKLKLDGTSTSVSWDGNSTDGYTTTINIADSYAGNSYTIQKGETNPVIYKITLTYRIGTGDLTLTTTDNMAGWRTFYDASQGYTLDGNTTAYVATSSDESTVKLTSIDNIPAGTPVILKDGNGDNSMTLTKATVDAYEDTNLLSVANGSETIENKYRLGYNSTDGVGFYPYSGKPAAGTVYLNVSSASARALSIVFDEEETGIKKIESATSGKENDAYYNLAGQRVAQPTKGLYIVNGKKVVIK